MNFTQEQRKRIDKLLIEGEEYNKKMKNVTYSHEEAWKPIFELIKEMEQRKRGYIQNQI